MQPLRTAERHAEVPRALGRGAWMPRRPAMVEPGTFEGARITLEAVPTPLVVVDACGVVLRANHAAHRLVGGAPDAWIGRALEERLPLRLDGHAARGRHAMTLHCPDGREVPVEVTLHADRTVEGNPSTVIALHDLSEQRHLETALRQAQSDLCHAARVATLGELIAALAHEVNQPLMAIAAQAAACGRWLAAGRIDEAQRSAGFVAEDAHRAGDIVARIRDMAVKAPPCPKPLDLNHAVREVLAIVRVQSDRRGIALQSRLAADLPHVCADRIQLQQVVLNLLVNAMEAMSKPDAAAPCAWRSARREIVVTSEVVEGEVVIAVHDSGPGVPGDSMERVFQPFYTTKAGGLGVGLAISRSITEAHHGRLWVEANRPHGAVFLLALPALEAPACAA